MVKAHYCFGITLFGAEGVRTSKIHSHFLRVVFIRGRWFNVLGEKSVKRRPCIRVMRRGGSRTRPGVAELLERKSTEKFNRANLKADKEN
jgi:hypothetical protein